MRQGLIKSIINFGISIEKDNVIDELKHLRVKEEMGIPIFFYLYPLFYYISDESSLGFNGHPYKEEGKGYTVHNSEKLSIHHLKFIEILATSIDEDAYKEFGVVGGIANINRICNSFDLDYKTAMNYFSLLSKCTISISYGYSRYSFHLFEYLLYDESVSLLKFKFSKTLEYIFAICPHVPIRKYLNEFHRLNESVFLEILFRYAMCYGASKNFYLSMNNLVKSIGVSENSFHEICEMMVNAAIRSSSVLRRIGLGLYTMSTYLPSKNKIIYNKMDFPKHVHCDAQFWVKIKDGNFDSFRVKNKQKQNFEKTEKPNTTTPSNQDELKLSFPGRGIIDERYFAYAQKIGFSQEQIKEELEKWAIYHTSKQSKYSNWYMAWQRWIKKVEIEGPNIGSPKNIIFNDDMKKIVITNGFNQEDGYYQFESFKSYYLSIGKPRANWVEAFNGWILRNKQAPTRAAVKTKKDYIDYSFYQARLVSEQIKAEIGKLGISIDEVISGSVSLNNVSFSRVPSPPSMGNGMITLFQYSDPEAQYHALKQFEPNIESGHNTLEQKD